LQNPELVEGIQIPPSPPQTEKLLMGVFLFVADLLYYLHMYNYMYNMMSGYGYGFGGWGPGLLVLAVWSLFWKGTALWHASRRNQGWWFIAMLLLNTAGILEIVYLFAIAKISTNDLFKFDGKK